MNAFAVPLADLERGPKHVLWVLDEPWINAAMNGSEATARGVGALDVVLTKDGTQVIVKGSIKAPLVMPCARTLDPVEVDVETQMLLMLTPQPGGAPKAKRARASTEPTGKGQDKGVGRLAKDKTMTDEEAAQDHYFGDEIVLDSFVREFILLELPMVPLRSDLRDKDKPAIPGPPDEALAGSGTRIDPRLAPLAEIAGRLKNDNKE